MALSITANQEAILNSLNTAMHTDYSSGIVDPFSFQIFPPVRNWAFIPSGLQQQGIDGERTNFACFLVAMGFDQTGLGSAGSPYVINYLKYPSGNGTLTFVGGLLVAAT